MRKINLENILILSVIVIGICSLLYSGKLFSPITYSFAEEMQETKIEADMEWETKKDIIMQEFDKCWAELEQSMSRQLRNLNQDDVNAVLTPLVVEKVAKKLGIKEEEVCAAIAEFD